MREPLEIQDEEHEQVIERVAAIDVAKASGMVCVRVPHESRPGRRVSRVQEVAATTRAVIELADHLACEGIEKVTVESTSDYWRIWVRHEAHCCIARVAGRDRRRCLWI
jgi:transposase